MKIEARAEKVLFKNSIDIIFMSRLEDGMSYVAEKLTMVKHREECCCDPTVSMRLEDAQVLMDDLWRCGLRPTEGVGSIGKLGATERHLEDMKKITFGMLSKNKII